MDEVYVRKDTFDETLKRIEQMMAASEARTQAQLAEIRGEVKALREKIDGNEDTLAAYIQTFTAKSSFWQGVLGVVIGLCAVIVAGLQVYLVLKG